jgi:hypothetical protein
MKSNEVGTTLKHPETINGNVKNLSKRIKMKDKGNATFTIRERPGSIWGNVPPRVPPSRGRGERVPCVPHPGGRVPVEHWFNVSYGMVSISLDSQFIGYYVFAVVV